MKTNELFKGFTPVSPEQWKLKIQADLKGGDYNDLLTHPTAEGIRIKPFYTEADLPGNGISPAGYAEPWKAGVLLGPETGSDIAARAAAAAKGGIHHLYAHLTAGLDWLHGIDPAPESLWLEVSDPKAVSVKALPDPLHTRTLLLLDPIGGLVSSGNWVRDRESDLSALPELVSATGLPTAFLVRADHYQQAGANRVQELAYSLAHIREYILLAGSDPITRGALENPVFRVAVGSDYFMEIAKLRAMRKLWQLLATDAGLPGHCRIAALPSLRNKTVYDYNTNLLRTTTECMAAIAGGADLVCNLPYDAAYHLPNEFADRIARNQLLILREEAHFARVANPADGAYYIESLTDQLGRKALDLLKTLEKGGGLLSQLKAHKIQKKIRESASREQDAFDAGERVLVGSNAYPNASDRMRPEIQKPIAGKSGDKTRIEPLPLRRLAAKYELERLKDEPK